MISINPIETPSKAVSEMSKSWDIISDLLGGTRKMRERGEIYLPKLEKESDRAYKYRLSTATIFPVLSRTVEILAAKPFSKPLQLNDNVPENIVAWAENIDLQGHDLQAFASDIFSETLAYGLSGVLVDSPSQDGGIRTQADEKAAGVRPYFVHYSPWNVIGWRTETVGGVTRLIQLRLKERRMEPTGDYGDAEVEYIRVLTPGAWQLWRKTEKSEWVLYGEGITGLSEIPFVPFYGNRNKGFMMADPALMELAYQNIEHYQSSSDQRSILHVARVPILFARGFDETDKIMVGMSSAVKATSPAAELQFVEHSGSSIGSGRQSLIDLEERMRQTGAELLVLQPGKITATQVYTEDEGNKCVLQRVVENFEDSLNQCLQFMADLSGQKTGGTVELFKDFGAATLTDASAQLLLSANQAGKLSDETLISEFKRRGILSPEIDAEKEKDMIDSQGPAFGTINAA